MPAAEDHFSQARSNRNFAEQLLGLTDSPDTTLCQWAVTAAFYCSVHCIEAYLDQEQRIHSKNHADRERHLVAWVPPPVHAAHERLKDFSQAARYDLAIYPVAFVRATVFDKYLARVTRFVKL